MFVILYHDHGSRENKDVLFKETNTEEEALAELKNYQKVLLRFI